MEWVGPPDQPARPADPRGRLVASRMTHAELIKEVGLLASRLETELHIRFLIHYHPDSRKIRTAPPFRKGISDLIICAPGGVMFAECKCPQDSLSPDQRAWQQALTAAGQLWVIWEPLDLFTGRIETDLCSLADRYGQMTPLAATSAPPAAASDTPPAAPPRRAAA